MLEARSIRHPTPEQCVTVLRAAGITEPLTSYAFLPMRDYTVNLITLLNGRYVLRASALEGQARFTRERQALDRLRDIPGIPRTLGTGTLDLGREAHYLLQTLIPGQPVYPLWLNACAAIRSRLVTEMLQIVRRVHQIPVPGYTFGYYAGAARDWRGTWLEGHDAQMRDFLMRLRARPLTAEQSALVDESEAVYAAHRASLAPGVGPRFAHGDLHLDNVLAEDGHVTGIIDWEWAGGGTEPDFDLAHLVRWAVYPRDGVQEALVDRVTEEDFAQLIPALLAAYPEVRVIPRLLDRMTIYQIEHELWQAASWPGHVPQQPMRRLQGWVRERRLAPYLP